MKRIAHGYRVLFALSLAVAVVGCSDDDTDQEVVKSSAKVMDSFKFATPEATGVIAESDKKITVHVPVGTNVTELAPVITVSEKATVSPNTGEKQNFTKAVTYTVKAEDGTTAEYVVTVIVENANEEPGDKAPAILSFDKEEVETDGEVTITGENFSEKGNLVFLVQEGTLFPGDVVTESSTSITFKASVYTGHYTVRVRRADKVEVESTTDILVTGIE